MILHLLDLPFCMESLGGVVMEIEDGNYPLVYGVVATSDVGKAFSGADCAVLLGAFPRKQGKLLYLLQFTWNINMNMFVCMFRSCRARR